MEEAYIYVELARKVGDDPELPTQAPGASPEPVKVSVSRSWNIFALTERPSHGCPYILAKTLGEEIGSMNLAALWGLLVRFPMMHPEEVTRAGYKVGPMTGEEIFRKILNTPGGVKIGVVDTENNLSLLKTPDKKIHIHFPEMESWVKEVTPASGGGPACEQELSHGSYGWKPHGNGGQYDHA